MRCCKSKYLFLLFLTLIYFAAHADDIDQSRFKQAIDQGYNNLNHTQEGVWNGPFFFIQMADCQLGFFERNASWEKEKLLLEKAVEHINNLKPRFVIVCGDLVHAWPRLPEIRKAQVHDYKQIMSKIDPSIPLVCVCGNHDVGNIPNRATIKMYESDFGSHYFSFWVGGTLNLAINSSLIWNQTEAKDIFLEQEQWLRNQLKLPNKPVHKFLFMHHPWYLETLEDEDDYAIIPVAHRKKYLDILANFGFTATFSGHLHYNLIHQYRGVELITTGALGLPLGDDPSGFRVVKVYKDHIEHAYFDVYRVPKYITLDSPCD